MNLPVVDYLVYFVYCSHCFLCILLCRRFYSCGYTFDVKWFVIKAITLGRKKGCCYLRFSEFRIVTKFARAELFFFTLFWARASKYLHLKWHPVSLNDAAFMGSYVGFFMTTQYFANMQIKKLYIQIYR